MNILHKKTILCIITLCVSIPLLFATPVADSSWYEFDFLQLFSTVNLYDNSVDVSYTTPMNVNFARILSGLSQPVPAGYGNLSLRFSTPGGIFRFVKVSDPTKAVDIALRLKHESNPTQNVSPMTPYPIVAGNVGAPLSKTDLFIDLLSQLPNGTPWRGDYYFPLHIEIIDRDGYVLEDKTLHMVVHLRERDNAVTPMTTLVIDQYPAAQEIPFRYPYQSGLPAIKVGGINFQSNEAYDKYKLRISPVGPTEFQFNHSNPNVGGAIKYKVTIPGRTALSYTQAFDFNLDYTGQIGNWYDFLEVAVRDVNYNNIRGFAGTYTSTIRIDLVSF